MGFCYGFAGYGNTILGSFWWIIPVLFWGSIITGIGYLIVSNRRPDYNQTIDTLERQYALGNISREEFLTRKRNLK